LTFPVVPTQSDPATRGRPWPARPGCRGACRLGRDRQLRAASR